MTKRNFKSVKNPLKPGTRHKVSTNSSEKQKKTILKFQSSVSPIGAVCGRCGSAKIQDLRSGRWICSKRSMDRDNHGKHYCIVGRKHIYRKELVK